MVAHPTVRQEVAELERAGASTAAQLVASAQHALPVARVRLTGEVIEGGAYRPRFEPEQAEEVLRPRELSCLVLELPRAHARELLEPSLKRDAAVARAVIRLELAATAEPDGDPRGLIVRAPDRELDGQLPAVGAEY